MHNILDYGAIGDGAVNDAPAIQRAIDTCAAEGGGVVWVPGGHTYLTGQLTLRSHVTLNLVSGATLLGSLDPADYPEGALIQADGAENLAITGTGTIDGQGVKFMREDRTYIYALDRLRDFRPRFIMLTRCRNVTLRDVTLRDSALWCVHLLGCEDVLIQGIRILNDLKVPNCDGIDPDRSRNVRISDCYIQAADDAIVLKARAGYDELGPCENITVTGCTLLTRSAGLKIGTESHGDIRNVVFDSCVVLGSSRGVSIQLRDGGNVENIICSNLIMRSELLYHEYWGKSEPIYISAYHRRPGSPLGRVRHVRVSNVLCQGENGLFIGGSEDSVIEDVALDNVRVEIGKTSQWPGGLYDRRPYGGGDETGVYAHRNAGVYVERARDVALRNVRVAWGERRPDYYGPALECHDVEGLELAGFQGQAAHPDRDPAMVIE